VRHRIPRRVTRNGAWIATWLLAGILLLAVGYFEQRKIPFYAGLLVTLSGVLNAVVLIIRGRL